MKTITARTINEIFINNLIKISVSLHAGTSSLTYAYGTPNHLKDLSNYFKIPFKYHNSKMALNELSDSIIMRYYEGELDNLSYNQATESPDDKTLVGKTSII